MVVLEGGRFLMSELPLYIVWGHVPRRAQSSLAIAKMIVDKAQERFGLA